MQCTSHPLIGDIPDESGKLWMINRMAGVSYTHLTCPSDFCLWRFEKFAQVSFESFLIAVMFCYVVMEMTQYEIQFDSNLEAEHPWYVQLVDT